MADLKIYNNGENKILFSAGDRIIRQPYDFGNTYDIARTGGSLTSHYIRGTSPIDNINNTTFSVVMYKKYNLGNGNNTGQFRFESNSYDCAIGICGRSRLEGFVYNKDELEIGNAIILIGSLISNDLLAAVFSPNKFKYMEGNSRISRDISQISLTNEDYNYFTFGRSARGTQSYERPLASLSGHELAIFNRSFSEGEFIYRRNNQLGSEWQSTNGMKLYWKMREAEILDFSTSQDGSDMRVGVRDFSGNNHHGQIMNLPAGTLQEQLDYANTNLFVPFIS